MPKMQRTPPSASKATLMHGQSLSESDLMSAVSSDTTGTNITVRCKRQRTNDDSPNKPTNPVAISALNDFKCELLEMLTKWKADHDQLLTTWKSDQDATLSKLASDVSDLKKQCQSIQTTNSEIERGMTFINNQYEDISGRVLQLEKEKEEYMENISRLQKQIQDLHFQSRQATIEIRNVPSKEQETPAELMSVVNKVGKIVNIDIQQGAFRDIYRIPGKPGLCRPIVAEFCCVRMRNDLLTKIRRYNKEHSLNDKLNTQSIGIEGVKTPIYVDEHLPPTVKKLVYETRKFAKTHNFSSWYSNGRILLRKNEGEKPLLIKSEKCLTMLSKKL